MKLHIVSDLHLESDPRWRLPATDADVLILAGDIHPGLQGMTAFARQGKPVLYVPGNHEYYGEHMNGLAAAMRLYAGPSKITVLDTDAVEIGGVRFLGTTLWTDFRLFGTAHTEAALLTADGHMNDYISIRNGERFLTPQQTLKLHLDAASWLEAQLDTPFDGPTVVITHHAPHPRSVHPKYAGHILNAAFVSDLSRMMGKADLWVHGHIHWSLDYEVNGTRIVCNPKGYGKENKNFKADLVIDLPVTKRQSMEKPQRAMRAASAG